MTEEMKPLSENMTKEQAAATAEPNQALRDLISGVADLCTLILDVTHGFSIKEIWEGIQVMSDVKAIGPEVQDLYAQYKSLDDASRSELMAYVSQRIEIPENVAVEAIVEGVLDAAIALSKVFQMLKKRG